MKKNLTMLDNDLWDYDNSSGHRINLFKNWKLKDMENTFDDETNDPNRWVLLVTPPVSRMK